MRQRSGRNGSCGRAEEALTGRLCWPPKNASTAHLVRLVYANDSESARGGNAVDERAVPRMSGQLADEVDHPMANWIEVASCVDADPFLAGEAGWRQLAESR